MKSSHSQKAICIIFIRFTASTNFDHCTASNSHLFLGMLYFWLPFGCLLLPPVQPILDTSCFDIWGQCICRFSDFHSHQQFIGFVKPLWISWTPLLYLFVQRSNCSPLLYGEPQIPFYLAQSDYTWRIGTLCTTVHRAYRHSYILMQSLTASVLWVAISPHGLDWKIIFSNGSSIGFIGSFQLFF